MIFVGKSVGKYPIPHMFDVDSHPLRHDFFLTCVYTLFCIKNCRNPQELLIDTTKDTSRQIKVNRVLNMPLPSILLANCWQIIGNFFTIYLNTCIYLDLTGRSFTHGKESVPGVG